MFDVTAIYGYLGSLKNEPCGNFDKYQKVVKESEIEFRNALTQCVLEKDGKGAILFLRDFQDLAKTLRTELGLALKGSDNGKIEWLSFQTKKAEEAVQYIKRVMQDLSTNESTYNASQSEPVEAAREEKVISGTEGLSDYLGCGKTKAFSIIKSGVLKDAGIQYMVGNCWKFNAEKLSQYISERPEILGPQRVRR